MTTLKLTRKQQDIIQFSKAVQRVEAKRHDFGNYIVHGHGDRFAKESKEGLVRRTLLEQGRAFA